MDTSTDTGRRKYMRRTDEERIKDLEARITELKHKRATKEKQSDPVLKEIPKIQRRLRKFAQFAMDNNRPDLANSTTAFNAGLERILRSEVGRSTVPAEPISDPPAE